MCNHNYFITELTLDLWKLYRHEIMTLEEVSFEVSRRDSEQTLEGILKLQRNVSLIAIRDERICGYALAAPLEHFAHVRGVDTDPDCGLGIVLYAADLVVAPDSRRRGIGTRLKSGQLKCAAAKGYRRVSGRVRRGVADSMWRIHQHLGAEVLQIIPDAYGDGLWPDEAIYYSITLPEQGSVN
jgi:GNAT superfamily N-acetyltransferase